MVDRLDWLASIRRFLVIAGVAFWLGGFTFYSGVVIPIGARVLGSHRRQGFITQQVTGWLNAAAIVVLVILAWNAAVIWRRLGRLTRTMLTASLVAMIAIQIELAVLHPFLDELLNSQTRQVIDSDRFGALHRIYLVSSSIQWGFSVLHLMCIATVCRG